MKHIWISFLAILLTACAGAPERNVQAQYDASANFAGYQTFKIEPVQREEKFARINPMIDQAIVKVLQSKGLSYVAAGDTDLNVRYATRVNRGETMRAEQITTGKGVFTRYNMEAVNEGELLVNVVDQSTNKVVWKGSSIRDLAGMDITKVTQERVDNAMTEVFASYPAK